MTYFRQLLSALVAILSSSLVANAQIYTWDAGGGATTTWSTPANWNPDGVPAFVAGDTFNLNTLDIAANSISTVDFNATLGIINIGDATTPTNSWTLNSSGGAVLTLNNNGVAAQINQSATSFGDTISVPLALAGDLNVNNASATATRVLVLGNISSAAAAGIQTIMFNGTTAGNVRVDGVISNGVTGGTVGLTVAGGNGTAAAGIQTVILNAANTLSGPISVGNSATTNLNILVLQNSNALGNATGITLNGIVHGGGTGTRLTLANGVTITDKVLTMTGGASQRNALFAGAGSTAAWLGNIVLSNSTTSGLQQFYADGVGGVLTLGTAANTITTTANNGITLRGATGIGTINSTINLGNSSFGLGKTDSGTWIINSTGNTWGPTGLSVGTLRMGVSNALPATTIVTMGQNDNNAAVLDLNGTSQTVGGLILNSGTTANTKTIDNLLAATQATLTVDSTVDSSFGTVNPGAARIIGNLQLVKNGPATLSLINNTKSYTGGTVVNAGILNVGGGYAHGVGGYTVNGGQLNINISGSFSGGVTITGGVFNPTVALAYTGGTTISGTGLVQPTGGGTLGNINNALTINGGTLDLNGTAQTVGLLSGTGGTITSTNGGANFSFGSNNATGGNYTGAIADGAGPITLNKIGTGTATLSGTFSYTGSTTVTAGTLNFGSVPPSTSSFIVPGGSTLNFVNAAGNAISTPLLDIGSGSGTATLGLELGPVATSDAITSVAAANSLNTTRFNITGLPGFGVGNYTLLTAPSGLTAGGAIYTVGTFPFGFGFTLTPTDTNVVLNVTAIVPSTGPIYWTGASTTSWNTTSGGSALNFSTDPAGTTPMVGSPNPTNTVIYSSSAATVGATVANTSLDSSYTINDLVFNTEPVTAGVLAITIAPGSGTNILTIAPALPADGIKALAGAPGSITISAPIGVSTPQTWTVTDAAGVVTLSGGFTGTAAVAKAGPGTLRIADFAATLGSDIAINAGTLNADATVAASTISTVLSGPGMLTKTGALAVTLTNANTHTGGTIIAGGTLNVNNGAALGTGSLTIAAGSTLGNSSGLLITNANNNVMFWEGSFTKSGNSMDIGTGAVTMSADVTLNITGNNFTVGGVISGAFGLTRAGAGTLFLNGANTFTGPFTITAGAVTVPSIANGGQPSPIGASTSDAANWVFNGGNVSILALSTTTNRSMTVNAAMRLLLPTPLATMTMSGNLVGAAAGVFNFNNANTLIGSDSTLTFTGDNSAYLGTFVIPNGAIVITNSNGLGTGSKLVSVTVSTNGTASLRLDGSGGNITLPPEISFTTSATAANVSGIINIAGNNTINGNFTLTGGNGGTNFQVNGGTLTLTGTMLSTGGTALRNVSLRGNGDGFITGSILANGTNALGLDRLDGTGTWTLTGNNTYTSPTIIASGRLLINGQIAPNSGTGTAAVNVTGGATSGGTFGGTGRTEGVVNVNVTSGAVPATLRPGDANAVGTLTLGGGLTLAAGGRLGLRLTDATTFGAPNTGASTIGTLPDPSSNNFVNVTGGVTTIDGGIIVLIDATGVTFTQTDYSYQVGTASNPLTLNVNNPSQFVLTGFPFTPTNLSLTGDATGAMFLNFSTPVPEPAILGLAALAYALGRRRVRRAG